MSGPLRFADHIQPTPAMLAWLDDANRILEAEDTPSLEALARVRYGDLLMTPEPARDWEVVLAEKVRDIFALPIIANGADNEPSKPHA